MFWSIPKTKPQAANAVHGLQQQPPCSDGEEEADVLDCIPETTPVPTTHGLQRQQSEVDEDGKILECIPEASHMLLACVSISNFFPAVSTDWCR